MNTEKLIQKLSKEVVPINRVYPVGIIFSFWIICSLLFLIFFIWSNSFGFNNFHFSNRSYELIPIILLILYTGYLAIHLSIPGNKLKKFSYLIPSCLFCIWLILIYMKDFLQLNELKLKYEYHGCIKDLFWMTAPPLTILLFIINRRIPIKKELIGYLLFTASICVSALGIALLCPNESISHLINIHFLPVFTISLFGAGIGKIFLRDL